MPFLLDQVDQLYFEELRPPNGPPSCDGYTPLDFYLTTVDEPSYEKAQVTYDTLQTDNDDFLYDLELATSNPDREICGVQFGDKEVVGYLTMTT